MKKFTKSILMLLLLCVGGVANAATTPVVDQRFTSIAALEGQKFAIVNEDVAKAFHGTNNQNLAFSEYATAFATTNSATSFRLVAATGDGVEGYYYLQSVKPDGTDYSYNGGGYLNAQPAETGWCCFILGLNGQNGQDFTNGAVWTLEENDGKFAIKNIGTNLYLKDAGNANNSDPTYFTLCTIKEELYLPEGELILDYFSVCPKDGIPYGYNVKFGSEDRINPTTYTGGARMFDFGAGGDFTKGLYFREGYVQYGTIKELALEAGQTYTVYFNSAMWKSSGAQMTFEIFKADNQETAVLTKTINNKPDLNGSQAAVSGSKYSQIAFTPETSGNYVLKWSADGWKEVILANVGVRLGDIDKSAYNTLKEQVLAINSDIDVSAADALAADATSDEAIDEAIASLMSALEDYLANAESEVNVTSIYVVNPSFETGNTTGWTYATSNDHGAKENSNGTYTISNADGNYVFNIWSSGNRISQTIESLPNGNYKLMALIATDAGNKVRLIANNESVEVDASPDGKGVGVDGTVEFTVLEGKATIGAEGVDSKWYKVDNFRLFYTSAIQDLTPYQEALAKAVEEANKIAEGTIPATAYSALQSVIEENNKEWSTADDYTTATNAITEATEAAKIFISPYSKFLTLKAIADDIVSAGTDNPSGQSNLNDAITTQSNNANTTSVNDINSAFSALKEEMTTYVNSSNPVGEGEKFNMTFMLTNPDLTGLPIWQKADGWHTEQEGGNSQVMTNGWATSEDGTKTAFFEYWNNPPVGNNLFALYQKVTLPAGTYNMSCYAFAQYEQENRHDNIPNGVYFYANDVQGSAVNNARLSEQSIEFVNESEQEVKIGLKPVTGNGNTWMGIGYVQLFKVPANTIDLDETEAYEPESKAGTVTLKKTIYSGWNTIALPFGVTAEQIASEFGEGVLYKYTGDEEGVLNFETAEAIAANTPYLFKSTGSAKSEMEFTGVTIAPGTPATAGTNFDFVGTYAPLEAGVITTNDYVLGESSFKKASGNNTLKAFRAYIQGKEESEARELKISLDGVVTAIETIDGKKVNSGAIYNLAGQRVKSTKKGLYIQDGKKFVK